MIPRTQAVQLIQDALNSLRRVGLIEQDVIAKDEIVLLGAGSPLDSMAFVTFIADLEDRLGRETGQELYMVLKEIHAFNSSNSVLTAGVLANFLVELAGRQPANGS